MPLVLGLVAFVGAVLLLTSGITDSSFADVITGKAGQLYRSTTTAGTGGTTTSTPIGGSGSLPKNAARLNPSQQAFAARLQADTGLSPAVIAGWLLSEEPASAGHAPNGANNWLNIGAFDSGSWAGGTAGVWSDPVTAADATASFILGQQVNGITAPLHASSGIRAIASSAGQSVQQQISAIQSSGWASSGYPGLAEVVGAFL